MTRKPRSARILTLLAAFTLATLLATAVHFTTPATPIAAQLAADGDEVCEMDISKANNTGGETEEDETFTWSIEVDSDDDCENEDYEVVDNVPSDFDIVSVSSGCTRSGNRVECNGEIDQSESDDYQIRVRAEDDCGTHTNTANLDPDDSTVQGDHSDSDTVRIECDDATIKIVKDTNPEDSSETFGFDIDRVSGSGGSHHRDFTLRDDGDVTFRVSPGSYVVSEDSESGWTLIDIHCTGSASFSDENHSDRDVRITVSDGESATCTFTNDRDDDPTPTRTPVPQAVATPVIIFIPAPPQPIIQPAAPPPPAPVAQVQEVRAPAPQPAPPRVALPRTGDGPLQSDSAALPIGLGLLVVARVGLTYWRLSRVRQ